MPSETNALLDEPSQSAQNNANKIAEHIYSCVKKILHDIFSEDVLIPGLLNFVRDFVWTFVSYDLLNARLQQTENSTFDAKGQWFSQQLYSTIAMFIALIAMAAFYKIKKPKNEDGELKKFPWAHGFIYLIAASIAIYGWDRMLVAGINVGQKLKLSANNAAYFAALFTGFEGFMQFFVIVALRTLTMDEYFTPFKQDPKKFFKQFFAGTFCSLTFVACPGANWQLFFALGVLKNWGAVPTSFAVASTVAFWNYASVKISVFFLMCMYQRCKTQLIVNPEEAIRVEIIPEIKSKEEIKNDVNSSVTPATTSAKRNWGKLRDTVLKPATPNNITDHLPSRAEDGAETEASPLKKIGSSAQYVGSGVYNLGSGAFNAASDTLRKVASSFQKPQKENPADQSKTNDSAFGEFVKEESCTV